MGIQVVHHIDSLLHIFNQFHVKEQGCHESANVDFYIGSVDYEVLLVKHNGFDDQPRKGKFYSENPQTGIEVAAELLIVEFVFVHNFFGVAEISHRIEIF